MTTATVRAALPAARRHRMSLWRLEWLRLTRTPRAIALAVLFAVIGLVEPVATRYASDLIGHLSHGARVSLPPPTPAQAINSYVTEITLIGLILVVALTAGALSFDTSHGLATFLRTKASSMWELVVPRVAVHAGAAAAAYVLGSLCAWYETRVLIGSVPAAAMLEGMLCGVAYFVLAVTLTALAASLVRSTIGTVAITLGILIALPIAGTFAVIASWLPSALVNAPVGLAGGTQRFSHYLPALAVSVAADTLALAVAVRRLRAREI